MKLAAEAPLWLALIFALLLVAGAAEDAARMRISNITCGLIFVAAIMAILVVGPDTRVWQNFVVFAALLVTGTPLFAAGKMGGGDIKLLAASGLWFDLEGGLRMLIAVLLAGGMLALLILAMRMFRWNDGARARLQLLHPKSGIPYGVAIAAGVLMTIALQRS